MAEFITPDFLQGNDVETIHKRMLDGLPPDIDRAEGGFPWDFTRPTALEKAMLVQFVLQEGIKNIFPQFAEEPFLSYHAENRGINKRKAENARVEITFTGMADTKIPAGFKVSTEATLDEPGLIFLLEEETIIPESGTIESRAICELSGKAGNVAAGKIIMQVKPLKGIVSITNNAASYGGFEEEDIETLRARVVEYDTRQGETFVGNSSDYKRWAESVAGVGNANVIRATDETGLVTIIITDSNGQAASKVLCDSVYNYIMRPDDEYQRLTSINGNLLQVIAPEALTLTISAKLELEPEYNIDMVKTAFVKDVITYFGKLPDKTKIRYHEICSVLINTAGVADHNNLLLNGGTENLDILVGVMPTIDENGVTFTL